MTTPSASGAHFTMNHAVQRAVFELKTHGYVSESTRQQLSPTEYHFALERASNPEVYEE